MKFNLLKYELTFPKLGLSFSLSKTAFSIFGLEIKWYGIIVGLAILVAVLYICSRSKEFGIEDPTDYIIWAILGGIIGLRLYDVLFNYKNIHSFLDVINIRNGGLAIYGGLISGSISLIIAAKIKKENLLPFMDLAAGGIILGQTIGRWGNFVNMECFGYNTNLPWGMTSASIKRELYIMQKTMGENVDPNLPVHPCFLYESVWCFIGFIVIVVLTKRRKFDGQLFLTYILWYSFGRFFIEGLRTDSLMLGTIRVSQMLSFILFVSATVTLVIHSKRKKLKKMNP